MCARDKRINRPSAQQRKQRKQRQTLFIYIHKYVYLFAHIITVLTLVREQRTPRGENRLQIDTRK